MKKLLSFVLFFLVGSMVYAGGYRVAIQGQRQLAMGHTGVAVISSAESVFFNPASMSFLDGKMNFSLGVSGIMAETAYENTTYGISETTDNPLGTPFGAYGTYKINEKISVGIAIYTPYGSSVKWEDDWAGSHLVNNIALKAIFFQPTVAVKISDQLSVGAGFIYASGSVKFNKNRDRTLTNSNGDRSEITIEETGISATGYTFGITLKPLEELTIGFNYRSKVDMEVEGGEATFENFPTSIAPANTTFDATLPMPAEITFGLGYVYKEKLTVAFDYNLTQWSEYEALTIDLKNVGVSTNLRNYKDSNTLRFGVEYKATKKVTARGGVYFDESPVQDGYFAPETPRNDSVGYTAGLSYQVNSKLSIDASFLYLQFDEIDNSYDHYMEGGVAVPFSGTYKSTVIAPGIGVSYKL